MLPAMSYGYRVRAVLRRARAGAAPDPWAAYLAGVEPGLATAPRVHRFAAVPILGRADDPALPLAVWIEPGDPDAVARTRAAVENGSVAPSSLLEGELATALASTRSERVVLLRAGDQPAPLALQRLGQAASLASDAAVLTCDHDALGPDGRRHDPHFAPGPSPDRWLACDDSGPLLVVAREPAAAAAPGLTGGPAWRHELALSLAGPDSQDHAHVPMLLCHRGSAWPTPVLSAEVAGRVVAAREPAAQVQADGDLRRVRYPIAGEPTVEVVICFRDRPDLLEPCVASVLERSTYERLRLCLVDNGSATPETAALLARLSGDQRVRVLRDARPFNFAALNNAASRSSTADVLVFLNNDTEVVDDGWVEGLLEEALRPEVGAVAPLLRYRDGLVQHAGAAIGLHEYAGHPFSGLTPEQPTPFGYAAQGTRNWLAVTAACMMVQRSKFDTVGGFDEKFVVAGNDVDVCLRLTAGGYRSLCVPHVALLHDESRSRGAHIDPGDFVASRQSYGAFRTVGDPFYNPNLTLRATDCGVRTPDEELT
jgi:GT2 family glycosyltransferase